MMFESSRQVLVNVLERRGVISAGTIIWFCFNCSFIWEHSFLTRTNVPFPLHSDIFKNQIVEPCGAEPCGCTQRDFWGKQAAGISICCSSQGKMGGAMKSNKPGLFGPCDCRVSCPDRLGTSWVPNQEGSLLPLGTASDFLLILHWKMDRWIDKQWTDTENKLLLVWVTQLDDICHQPHEDLSIALVEAPQPTPITGRGLLWWNVQVLCVLNKELSKAQKKQ